MALKPSYNVDGHNWMPQSRAAKLLGTNVVGVRRLMGNGELDWRQLRAGSTTLLVSEAAVLALRTQLGVAAKQRAKQADSTTGTAHQRGRSMLAAMPALRERASGSVFDRTWDPSAVALPIAGRETKDKSKP